MKTVCLCIPHNYSQFDKYFVMSLLEMVQYFFDWGKKAGYQLSIICQPGYQLDEMRNTLVQVALDNKQDYLVFLDTDMTFPRNTLVKLVMDIEKNKKYKVEAVTGLYVRKSPPYMPHVYAQFCPERKNFRMLAQFPLDKLFTVEGAGCGCLIVKSEVFKRAKQPYFKFRTNNKTKEKMYGRKGYMPSTVGEDLYFFLKTKPITFCDPTIQCGHYKQVGFGIEDFLKYNGIEGDRHGFTLTPEKIKEISEKYIESKSGGA